MLRKINDNYEPVSEINVTPFVDVLLVLLVIFMITAPLFTKAIDIQLPKENLRSSKIKDARQFVITINKSGRYYLQGRKYSSKRLLQKVVDWKGSNKNKPVFIRADKRVRYKNITTLMVMLKNNGVHNIGLLVEEDARK